MSANLTGRARRFGDNVNTDYIITSTRKRETLDETELARYLFETLDPAFAASVRAGDIIVAGRNFGCGSAMEIAATVILAAGIKAVLASSFSRTFYRNAVNNGLLPLVCETSNINEGDTLTIRSEHGAMFVRNTVSGAVTVAAPLPPVMEAILSAGGLVGFVLHSGRPVDPSTR
ncbi:MAG TPA: 3-isopropylmalate dehydratase [Gemmatimonadaceae bacterium]|nr:3-isopropylmalate dehydratase [Gemmatimonadaceae bacterium]